MCACVVELLLQALGGVELLLQALGGVDVAAPPGSSPLPATPLATPLLGGVILVRRHHVELVPGAHAISAPPRLAASALRLVMMQVLVGEARSGGERSGGERSREERSGEEE